MKYLKYIFALIITAQINAQISQDVIYRVNNNPKKIVVDQFEEKQKEGIFTVIKHMKYVIVLEDNKIISQVVNDTVGAGTPMDFRLEYNYKDAKLASVTTQDLKENLQSTNHFVYKDSYLEKEEQKDEIGDIQKTIFYSSGDCDDSLTAELPKTSNDNQEENRVFCKTETHKNNVMQFKIDAIFFNGLLNKHINYKNNSDTEIHNTISYIYNEEGQLIEETKQTASGSSYKTIYEYDDKNNLTHKKARFVEFFYQYKYDEFGNWIEKIETSKVKSRRRIYKRKIAY